MEIGSAQNELRGVESQIADLARQTPRSILRPVAGGGDCEMFADTICLRLNWFTHNWAGGLPEVTSSATPETIGFAAPAGYTGGIDIANALSGTMFDGVTLAKVSETSGDAVYEAVFPDFLAYVRVRPIAGVYVVTAWMSQFFEISGISHAFRVGSPTSAFTAGGKVPGLVRTSGSAVVEPTLIGVTNSAFTSWIWFGSGTGPTASITVSWGDECGTSGPSTGIGVSDGGTAADLETITDISDGGTFEDVPADISDGGTAVIAFGGLSDGGSPDDEITDISDGGTIADFDDMTDISDGGGF